jgi:kinetochore protein Nuf2
MADTSFYGSRKSVSGSHSLKLKQEKFSFPLLQNHEIVECLAELHVSMDEADLAKARPAQLRHIYELLLCDCLDLSKEQLYQPKFSGLDALTFADLHEESVPMLHFIRGM